jgi:hypothetical protein
MSVIEPQVAERPALTTKNLTANMKTALLMRETRISAVDSLSTGVRVRGGKHADVLRLVQEVYREAGKPVPEVAEIDDWLAEAEERS